MASWSDIQKLASDLQRVQLSQSSKKLSEVNCVEVLQKLIGSKLIDVVFTRDGHSYVTKKHLETEIKNECIAAGGRAPLTDIAASLNIDFDHIERTARLIIATDDEFTLSNAELFATEYVHRLRNELRDLLEEHGNQTTSALCKHWNLSPELLQSLLIEKLPADFQGVVDGDTIYTRAYLDSRELVLRAVLVALTKITPLSTVQKRVGLTPKRFWHAFDHLQSISEVPGTLIGSKTSPACSYRPKMYDSLVSSCVLNRYRQNEYLQISTLKTLGVDAKSSLEEILGAKEFKNLTTLDSMYMTKGLMEQCVQTVQEDLQKSGITEVRVALQPLALPLDAADENLIGERVAATDKDASFAEGFVFRAEILAEALKSVGEQLEKRAHAEVDRLEKEKKQQGGGGGGTAKVPAKIDDNDDWTDKKGGKGGKKGGGGKGAKGKSGPTTSTTSSSGAIVVGEEELESWLRDTQSVPEEILAVAVEKLVGEATAALRKKILEIQAQQLVANSASSKKSLVAMGDKCRQLYDSFNTFEAATTSFADPLGSDLRQYLLKSIGSELAVALLSYATGVDNAHQLKEKQRDETIESLPDMLREPIKALFATLKSSTDDSSALEAFHDAVYDCSVPSATSLALRKVDKKGRAEVGTKLTAELRDQLAAQSDPATTLLLAVLYILAQAGRPTTASGKFVAQLVAQIKDLCSETVFDLLQSCQKGVVTCIKNKDDEVAKEMLAEDIKKLKAAVLLQ